MRAIWKGSINFGLVNIPVALYSATHTTHGLDLDLLSKEGCEIRYARVCRTTGEEVPWNHVVKGYEHEPGDYVVLEQSDFDKAQPKKTKTIDIHQFAEESEIDSRFYDKPYYLEPQPGADKAYNLLRQSLDRTSKVAIATFVLRNRENLAAIKPVGKLLILDQMYYLQDLREPVDIKLKDSKPTEAELKMSSSLINQLTKPFIAEEYHDTYTEELEKVIKAKAKGKTVRVKGKAPATKPTKDLIASLKKSLEQTSRR